MAEQNFMANGRKKKIQQQYIQSREIESLELEGGGGNKEKNGRNKTYLVIEI